MNGAAKIEAIEDLSIDFFESLIFFSGKILCSGITVFCPILIMRLLAPNNPVSNGSNGSLIFMFKLAIPRNPTSKNMKKAQSLLFFSELIKNPDTEINIIGIIFCICG